MKQDKDFTDILNECLERLLIKGESLEGCLENYPEQAARLKPLLKTALQAKGAVTIQPRAEFKARARFQFHQALGELTTQRPPARSWLPGWLAATAVILALMLVGVSTVAAANSSMPDSPLYPVKLAAEEVRLALTPTQMGKASFCAQLADRRVDEIVYLANKKETQQLERVTQRLDMHLGRLVSIVSEGKEAKPSLMMVPAPAPEEVGGKRGFGRGNHRAELRLRLEIHAATHQARLEEELEEAPEEAKPALRQAMEVSATGYQKAIEALD